MVCSESMPHFTLYIPHLVFFLSSHSYPWFLFFSHLLPLTQRILVWQSTSADLYVNHLISLLTGVGEGGWLQKWSLEKIPCWSRMKLSIDSSAPAFLATEFCILFFSLFCFLSFFSLCASGPSYSEKAVAYFSCHLDWLIVRISYHQPPLPYLL